MNNVYNYLERLDNLMRAEIWKIAIEHQLQPIQLQMLDYLDRCNRYSNSPTGVAIYFQLTKGTVSQSLRVLEKRSLLTRQRNSEDKRKVHMSVTDIGKKILDETFPLTLFQEVRNNQETSERTISVLQKILSSLQQQNNLKSFGVCHTCHHLQTEANNHFRCGLTHETLAINEIELICREHLPVAIE